MIYYTVTREDLMKASTFKWQKVLQPTCSTNEWYVIKKEFYIIVKQIKLKVLYKQIDMEEANREIRKEVLKLTEKYPSAFPKHNELGYYSKNILAEKFMLGELTINSTYDVNIMLSERISLLKEIVDAETVRLNKEKERIEAERIAKEVAEATKVPIEVGMLFHTKQGIARAFLHQYPKGTKLHTVLKELPNSVTMEFGKFTLGRQCWKITGIFIEGGRAYQDDLVIIGEQDAN